VATVLLLADLGNSRLKLALATGAPRCAPAAAAPQVSAGAVLREPSAPAIEFHATCALDVGTGLASALEQLGPAWRAELGALSSVAAPEAQALVERALAPRCARGLRVNPTPLLRIATSEPERTGRDRIYGACAAWARFGEDCLSVDAGTALTVNLVRATAGDAAWAAEFCGGAIAPGAALLARALATGGARLHEVEPRAVGPALGRDTRAALEAGIVHGLRGAARELVERIEAEHGGRALPIALTGGARALLAEPSFAPRRRVLVVESLVLEGLAQAVLAAR
jgi:pantothenate kinase type III